MRAIGFFVFGKISSPPIEARKIYINLPGGNRTKFVRFSVLESGLFHPKCRKNRLCKCDDAKTMGFTYKIARKMQFSAGQNLSCSYALQSAIIIPVRWPPTRNPERTKDEHRVRSSKPADCKVPGSVGSDPKVRGRKQAPGRRSVQRSRGIGGEGASRVKRQCANRSICAGGRLYV